MRCAKLCCFQTLFFSRGCVDTRPQLYSPWTRIYSNTHSHTHLFFSTHPRTFLASVILALLELVQRRLLQWTPVRREQQNGKIFLDIMFPVAVHNNMSRFPLQYDLMAKYQLGIFFLKYLMYDADANIINLKILFQSITTRYYWRGNLHIWYCVQSTSLLHCNLNWIVVNSLYLVSHPWYIVLKTPPSSNNQSTPILFSLALSLFFLLLSSCISISLYLPSFQLRIYSIQLLKCNS